MLASWPASRGPVTGAPARILCLDPGITTGWAYFKDGDLVACGQELTASVVQVVPLLERFPFDALVVEGYRIYAHKIAEHVGSSVYTLQLIGAIELWRALVRPDSIAVTQYASQAKPFVTDDKLKRWSFYQRGQKHARDAIRHGCYYLVFGGWRFAKRRTEASAARPLTGKRGGATMTAQARQRSSMTRERRERMRSRP